MARSVVAAPRVLDEGVDVPNRLGSLSRRAARRQMIQRMGRICGASRSQRRAFRHIFAADTLEDRFSEDRDGFLEEIEEIAESSRSSAERVRSLGHLPRLPARGAHTARDGRVVRAAGSGPEEITEWTAEAQPYPR